MSEQSAEYVITGVRSRTHLLHIAAYLRRELTRLPGELTVRYVGGGNFLGNASVSDADIRSLLPADDRLSVDVVSGAARWAPSANRRLTYIAVGAPGIKPWINLRRKDVRQHIRVVVTDEGIGSYGDWRTRRDAWRRQGVKEPWTTMRALAVESGRKSLTTQRFALYDKARGWALQPDIKAEFLRADAEMNTGMARADAGSRRDHSTGPGRVVLLTQPWPEIGALSQEDYLGFVREIEAAALAAGKRLQVRAHPAEDDDRYREFERLRGPLPAELDPRIVSADAVVGGTSTALLNLSALHGIPAARLVVPGLERLEDELGADQRALLDAYLPAPTQAANLGELWSSV